MNPLEALGLNRQIVRRLPVNELEEVVKALYRGLQLMYHPDRQGGSSDKSQELNAIYQQLLNRDQLQRCREEYLQTSQQKKDWQAETIENLRKINVWLTTSIHQWVH